MTSAGRLFKLCNVRLFLVCLMCLGAASTLGASEATAVASSGQNTFTASSAYSLIGNPSKQSVMKVIRGSNGAILRVAQKRSFKYEVPKAPRVAPRATTRSAPRSAPNRSYSRPRSYSRHGVRHKKRGAKGAKSPEGAGVGMSIQIGPFGVTVGQ